MAEEVTHPPTSVPPPEFAPPSSGATALRGGAKAKVGKVLQFDGASPSTNRSEIAALCGAHGDVAFVDFSFGATSGHVRFRTSEGATAALAALSAGAAEVGGATPTWRILSEEEVIAYWDQSKKSKEGATQLPIGRQPPVRAKLRNSEQGIVLKFERADPSTNRTDLTALCSNYGDVAFVDFKFHETSGYVRFRSSEGAQAALAALGEATVQVGGATPVWRLLSPEEESSYREGVQAHKRLREDAPSRASSKPLEPSLVVHVEGLGSTATREELSDACVGHAEVAFVDYRQGETSGYVRFRTATAAQTAAAALAAASPELGGQAPRWRLLTEAEADAYRQEVQAKKRSRQVDGTGKGKGGGRKAPRGWGFGAGKGNS